MNSSRPDSEPTSGEPVVDSGAALAEQIARRAHAGQFRRDGVTPYITHPEAIVKKLSAETDEVRAAAWLHDVLEDTGLTAANLLDSGISPRVIEAVVRLTKSAGQSYERYLEGVKGNEIARPVKVADMLHNLGDSPTLEQIIKYERGLLVLLD